MFKLNLQFITNNSAKAQAKIKQKHKIVDLFLSENRVFCDKVVNSVSESKLNVIKRALIAGRSAAKHQILMALKF